MTLKSITSRLSVKNLGLGLVAAFAVITLIRCSSSDQDVAAVTDAEASAKVKEAEAAEAAHAQEKNKDQLATEKTGKKSDKKKATKTAKNSKSKKESASETKTVAASEGGTTEAKSETTKTETETSAKHTARHPASKNSMYVVQVGAFKVKENAEKLVKKLADDGFAARLESMNHSQNGDLNLVRIGPMANKTEAQEAAEKLNQKESMRAQVIAVDAEN